MVECLTRDRGAAGSGLIGVTALWSLSKMHLSKTRPCLTERLLMVGKDSNQKQTNFEHKNSIKILGTQF